MDSSVERRQEPRYPAQRDIVHELVTVGLSEDISIHGLRMIGLAENSVGQEVRLHVEAAVGRLIPVPGVVAWRAAGDDGIRLAIRIANPSRAWIAFVQELQGQKERESPDDPASLRSAPRFSAVIPARYGLKANEEEDCVLLDVSPGGLQLQGPVAPPAGTSVFVIIETAEYGRVNLLGRVVWRASDAEYPRVGIRLDSADESYYRMLAKLSLPARRQQAEEPKSRAPVPTQDDLLDGVGVEVDLDSVPGRPR